MKITPVAVEASLITEVAGLDGINAYWADVGPGKGYVTITCYGSAWTAYFGAMGGDTIREFFLRADTGYLATKLGITPQLKQTKRDNAYLSKIIDAVRESLREMA